MKSNGGTDAIPHAVLEAALGEFTTKGYADARLDAISSSSGVSKRMLHYHCGDKMGLYRSTMNYVLSLLRPTRESLQFTDERPVDALRHVVGVVFDCFADHPMAVRFIAQENMHPVMPLEESGAMAEASPIVLAFDRVLLLGRDFGAFRTDVSAMDIYYIVASMAQFPTLNERTFHNLYSLELTSEVLIDRLREMARDAVTGFLTASNSWKHGASYVTTTPKRKIQPRLVDEVYADDQDDRDSDNDNGDVAPEFTDMYDDDRQ
ncbi:TetR family transcriptional regulator [uncultured Corynebacterium sp.]|uniref:TetR family transcriptional regulator n=1 Tax=uncultured Corynebacterium sp. TaxID=159447 RepID=UPI0026236D99|nr:TetR family transcriptional regulator [uncultured Corynebacterium sp.]